MILSVFFAVNIQLARKPCSIRPELMLNPDGINAQFRRLGCAIWTEYAAVQGVIYCDKLFKIERYCKEHCFS